MENDGSDKKRHGFLRRIANPFFSQTFLKELEPTIQRYYQIFVNGISEDAKRNQGIVDLTEWIDHLVLDVRNA
jgi:cytochrome P450